MHRLDISSDEIEPIQALLHDLTARYTSPEDADFLHNASIYAHELPRRLRAFLNDFRLSEVASVCVIAGFPIDDARIGMTPTHWKYRSERSTAIHEEIFFLLCSSLLGEAFGWVTQQGGHIVHDIFPIEGHEYAQLGSGSEEALVWHTEEAFHPYRCDYLGLMCLRNPEQVATSVASIDMLELAQDQIQILFEPRFTIRPDESHLEKNLVTSQNQQGQASESLERAYANIHKMNDDPQKVPVLFGDPRSPYLRIDPFFMNQLHDDQQAQCALESLMQSIDEHITDIVLQPGEICFIDNYRSVHGRKSFKARYDGSDRWLKRINITRDLRKSRMARHTSDSRVIF